MEWGMVLNVDLPEKGLLGDGCDGGRDEVHAGDSCCIKNLLEDWLKGLRVDDVVVDEFLTDAGAAKK